MSGIHEREANFEAFEDTVDASANITFGMRSSRIIATNDSQTGDLRLVMTGNTMTMKPKETVTLPFRLNGLVVKGANVPYRIWNFF